MALNTIQTNKPGFLSQFSDLSNNDMGVITGKLFGGTSSIGEHLYLNANNLTGISYDAFDNVNLGYIYLSDNQLTVYPQAVTLQNPQRM